MSKIIKIFEDSLELSFQSPSSALSSYYSAFLNTDLGKIYQALPWDELVSNLGLKSHRQGRRSHFSPKGKIGLMFLKHYSGASDKRLIEQLNGNIHYQLFCGCLIAPDQPLNDYKIVSKIRCQLSEKLDIDRLQEVLAKHWKGWMHQTESLLVDATCYESSVRYPTDQKLLWESVDWSYQSMVSLCKQFKHRLPRTKYNNWALRMHQYQRKRKPRKSDRIRTTRGLLRLLDKLIGLLDHLEAQFQYEGSSSYQERRRTITQVYNQQWIKFTTHQNPQGRIISLAKPYLRPIVRGKETKAVEFGAKVNKIQIDGINFIQKLSFDNFNESTCLQDAIWMGRRYVGRIAQIGADAIYATNANRTYCSGQHIQTNFKRKGRPGKYEAQRKVMASLIGKERATRLEGSFGTEKQHYLLHHIRARTRKTEILWIFFGIHTANALHIGQRIAQKSSQRAA